MDDEQQQEVARAFEMSPELLHFVPELLADLWELGSSLEVMVDERGVERAIRQLKRKIASEGVTKELKRRKHYEKPSVRKRRKSREAERRRRRKERRAQLASR